MRDAAGALVGLIGSGQGFEVLNVASGREVPVRQVLDHLLDLAGVEDWELDTSSSRPGNASRAVADVSRLRARGFEAVHPLSETLSAMLDYYRWVGAATRSSGGQPCG